jgi:hypothetical protein
MVSASQFGQANSGPVAVVVVVCDWRVLVSGIRLACAAKANSERVEQNRQTTGQGLRYSKAVFVTYRDATVATDYYESQKVDKLERKASRLSVVGQASGMSQNSSRGVRPRKICRHGPPRGSKDQGANI